MKILITGAAGFVGRNLIDEISAQNIKIIAVDNFNNLLYSRKIKKANFEHISKYKTVKCFNLDVLSLPNTQIFKNFDCIINLAALPGQQLSWEYINEYTESNFLTVSALLRRFCANQNTHFIQASTSSVYGKLAIPKSDSEPNPDNPYGITKLASEHLIKTYRENFQVNYSILRLFSIYGPYQRPDMGVYKFLQGITLGKPINIYGNGLQSRALTYIKDAVKVINATIEKGPQNISFDVSGSEAYSVNEIVSTCELVVGKKAQIKFVSSPLGDQMHTKGDCNKLKELYGLNLETNLEYGLKQQLNQMNS